ncbi:MAG: glycosyltransferase family 4 protein [Burkholderiales bacterium]
MRVLFACELYAPSVGGVQEVVRQVAGRLAERSHQVTVATSRLPERSSQRIDGVDIIEFAVSGNLARGISGETDAYRRLVLQGDYDVFMVKAAQQWTFDALIPVLDQIKKPKIFVPCGFSGLYEPAYSDYYRRMPDLMRKFDHLIFYASAYRDINLAREHGLSALSIVPNGASEREFMIARDPDFRRRHGISANAFVVLTVGSLTGLKGHRELAEAFDVARLRNGRQAVLILNGNNPTVSAGMRARLVGLLKPILLRAGLGGLLKALGASIAPRLEDIVARINRSESAKCALLVDLSRSELVQAYLNSDLFVFASNIEYSPLVLFESAAAGLPFLSVPVGNSEEIARWTGAGEICPAPRDARGYTRVEPRELAAQIEALVSDPERLNCMGKAGRASWLERYTWAKIADHYEALFERVIAEKSRDAGADKRPVAARRPEAAA